MGTSSTKSLQPTNAITQSSGAPCDPPVVSVSYPVFCDLQGDRPAASPPQGSLRMHPSTMRVVVKAGRGEGGDKHTKICFFKKKLNFFFLRGGKPPRGPRPTTASSGP